MSFRDQPTPLTGPPARRREPRTEALRATTASSGTAAPAASTMARPRLISVTTYAGAMSPRSAGRCRQQGCGVGSPEAAASRMLDELERPCEKAVAPREVALSTVETYAGAAAPRVCRHGSKYDGVQAPASSSWRRRRRTSVVSAPKSCAASVDGRPRPVLVGDVRRGHHGASSPSWWCRPPTGRRSVMNVRSRQSWAMLRNTVRSRSLSRRTRALAR
jgi:hypothetical protein